MRRRNFGPDFKQESASLILDKGYTIKEASDAVGVSQSSLCKWVKQLKEERQGSTPIGKKAITFEQQKIQELEAKIRRIEREKEILKKATALLMSDETKF